jgi:hypothetical protein
VCVLSSLSIIEPKLTFVQTIVMKKELSASIVFSSMAVFNLLRNRLSTILFLVNYLVAGKVSLDRVNDFLNKVSLFFTSSFQGANVFDNAD